MSLPSRAQSDLEDRAEKVLDILQLVLATNVCDEVHSMLIERIKDAMSVAGLEGVEASELLEETTKMLVGVLTEDDKK